MLIFTFKMSYLRILLFLMFVRLYMIQSAEQCQTIAGREICITIDLCEKITCQNGGKCSSDTCICADGFTGSVCQTNINECESNPCQNGGECIDNTNSYTCTCASGYEGTNCETTCTSGFYGENCQSVCTCTTNNTEICNASTGECVCNPGYYPGNCSQECSNMTYGQDCGFNCTCDVGNSDSCDPTNGTCSCTDGWTDENCTSMILTSSLITSTTEVSSTVESAMLGVIVGVPVGAVILILVVAIIICCVCRAVKRKRNKPETLPPIEYVDSKAGITNGSSKKNGTLPATENDKAGVGISNPTYPQTSVQRPLPPSLKMPLPEVPAYVNSTFVQEVDTRNPADEGPTKEGYYENFDGTATQGEVENDYDFIPADDHLIDAPAYTDLVDPSMYYI